MGGSGVRDDHVVDEEAPLLLKHIGKADDHALVPGGSHQKIIRSGTLWSSVAHIITAVIGSGVLSLAWSIAQLGWIGGPLAVVYFASITYVGASLLSDCYRSPDPVTGTRNRSYTEAVRAILGEKQAWLCGLLQYLNFYGTGVAYIITTATCMRAIMKSNCYHNYGHDAPCEYDASIYMLYFGVIQIAMSQIPDFHSMVLVSVIAAAMSFCYATIGFGLGIATVAENGKAEGSIIGVPAAGVQKIWLTFQALGDIAYAYPYAVVLLEIQDTVKSPPAENGVMKKASGTAILITTFFYLGCGCFGYAAFGNNTPGNLLTGFGFYEPYWLVDFANACIIFHLIGGYQVYSQPVYASMERTLAEKYPNSEFLQKSFSIKLPLLPVFHLSLFRLCFRTAYVVSATLVAMVLPYFNEILSLLGSLNLWPLTIYFPVEMYIVQSKMQPWTKKWVALQIFSSILMVASILAFTGSIAGLVQAKMGLSAQMY